MFNLADVLSTSGATLDPHTLERVTYTQGHSVGGAIPPAVLHISDRDGINAAVLFAGFMAQMRNDDSHVGIWVDGDSVHVDVSTYVRSKSDAISLGFARKEYAIWDWRRGYAYRILGSTRV